MLEIAGSRVFDLKKTPIKFLPKNFRVKLISVKEIFFYNVAKKFMDYSLKYK